MIFNVISNLAEHPDVTRFNAYNHIIAYNLKKWLTSKQQTTQLICDAENNPPNCDYTIIVSNAAMKKLQTNTQYREAVRKSTRYLLCLWIDSDFSNDVQLYDRILCANRKTALHPQTYRWVGWAADPALFYPEQTESSVYVDPYMTGFYGGKYDDVYTTIKKALISTKDLKINQPVAEYNHGRVSWLENASVFRRTTHYILTQPCYWGWTNIEAATCGAILLVHKSLDLPRTWPSPLNIKNYSNSEELQALLEEPVDVESNRRVALRNSWSDVADRVVRATE